MVLVFYVNLRIIKVCFLTKSLLSLDFFYEIKFKRVFQMYYNNCKNFTLELDGVEVVENVLTHKEVIQLQNKIWLWLEHKTKYLDKPIVEKNVSTYRSLFDLYPKHGMLFQHWDFGHNIYPGTFVKTEMFLISLVVFGVQTNCLQVLMELVFLYRVNIQCEVGPSIKNGFTQNSLYSIMIGLVISELCQNYKSKKRPYVAIRGNEPLAKILDGLEIKYIDLEALGCPQFELLKEHNETLSCGKHTKNKRCGQTMVMAYKNWVEGN